MSDGFDHERLKVYAASIEFVAWLEGVLPAIKQSVAARDHIVRASASVPVNIAEASGKFSANDRCQFVDIAYGSALECAACLDILGVVACISKDLVRTGKQELSIIVSMLIGYRQATGRRVAEDRAPYVAISGVGKQVIFDHERLDVYQKALDFVRWCNGLRQSGSLGCPVEKVLDKASTAVTLNIAEGNGKFSKKDRCRFIGHARTAALQAAATLDVFATRHGVLKRTIMPGKMLLVDSVKMLVALQRSIEET